jgi:membrane protease YdiL (CAAX protease family)
MVAPSLLLVKDTKKRLSDLKNGLRSLIFLPLTIGGLAAYVLFAMDFLSGIPVLGWSWLGYNIALGPFAGGGVLGILPFIPMLVYMLIHVNYFEEMYFRKSAKLVVLWAFLHVAMGVAVHVALVLLPIGFLYRYLYVRRGIDQAYSLHLVTNLVVLAASLGSYFLVY